MGPKLMKISVTDTAIAKILDILAEENNPKIRVRLFVQGGGCSGFSYGFTLDEVQNEDDWEISASHTSVLVDAISANYLDGAEIDYHEDLHGSEFKINNPQAVSTCGCGSSFSTF
jgi:iron-sulfur cluster insertion protein